MNTFEERCCVLLVVEVLMNFFGCKRRKKKWKLLRAILMVAKNRVKSRSGREHGFPAKILAAKASGG